MDPTNLINAMMRGGVRGGSPLGDALSGGSMSGSPLDGLLGALLGGRGAMGGASGGGMGSLGSMLGGGGVSNDMLGQLAGAALGGAFGARSGGGFGGAAGMAVLGGLAAKLLQNYLGSRGETGASPATEAAAEMVEADRASLDGKASLCVRAMIEAAKCDGEIDASEREAILAKIASAGCSEEERAHIDLLIRQPPDVDGLVARVSDRQTAAEVITASLLAIKVDSEAEKAYLRNLCERLGLGGLFV